MATSCRRLASLLRRNWSSIPSARSQLGNCLTSSYKVPSSRLAVCAMSSSVCPRHRHLATKAIDSVQTPVNTSEPVDTEPGFLTRFWRWFNEEEEEYVMTETEKKEREEMLERVQAMYFANPPIAPSLEFYKEAFELLVKYDDGFGVETLWNFMREMNVTPDAELEAKVKPFLEKTRGNVWF